MSNDHHRYYQNINQVESHRRRRRRLRPCIYTTSPVNKTYIEHTGHLFVNVIFSILFYYYIWCCVCPFKWQFNVLYADDDDDDGF